jgi:DNA adenine methylase Dam
MLFGRRYVLRFINIKKGDGKYMENQYIKSPFNYTGGKYKLLPQIIPLFPNNINTFYDVFCGGCNVGVNVKAQKIVCNDILSPLIDCFNLFKEFDSEIINDTVLKCITCYGLSKINQDGYLKLRNRYNFLKTNKKNDFNKTESSLILFVLICYSFNNQIRFNNSQQFNMPFGKNRSYNPSLQNKTTNFINHLKKINIQFTNYDFQTLHKKFQFEHNDFVYLDPPYSQTTASYNENGGWNKESDLQLFKFLDGLNENGIRFAMSNLYNTEWLIEWSKKYNVNFLDYNYKNCNYQKKDKSGKEQEILVTNY